MNLIKISFVVGLLLSGISTSAFASGFTCKNAYSDDGVITLSVKNATVNSLDQVELSSENNGGLGTFRKTYPVAKFDPTYKPTPKNAKSIRYRILESETTATTFSLLVPKTITSKKFRATLANSREGYHGETGYHKLACTLGK